MQFLDCSLMSLQHIKLGQYHIPKTKETAGIQGRKYIREGETHNSKKTATQFIEQIQSLYIAFAKLNIDLF